MVKQEILECRECVKYNNGFSCYLIINTMSDTTTTPYNCPYNKAITPDWKKISTNFVQIN